MVEESDREAKLPRGSEIYASDLIVESDHFSYPEDRPFGSTEADQLLISALAEGDLNVENASPERAAVINRALEAVQKEYLAETNVPLEVAKAAVNAWLVAQLDDDGAQRPEDA
jgi:hypothetical protein